MAVQTPLHESARSGGAVFSEQAGHDIPDHFGDPLREYAAVRESAAIFDRTHHGRLEVSGKDAPSFLHNLCTNDIQGLPLGGGCEAYFCDHRAKALNHACIYHVLSAGRHAFHLDTWPGFGSALLQHLDKHLISEAVELVDFSSTHVHIHLAGPKAPEFLSAVTGQAIPDLPELLHMERTIGGRAVTAIRRHDPLGSPGYDLIVANEAADGVWRMLWSAGAVPAGSKAWELLRVEAGTPIYGIDVLADRFVMETPRPLRAVSYNKGCYLGQEPIVMARDRTGFVNRSFFGVKGLTADPLPVGTKLLRDGAEVGLVTSSIQSPRLAGPLSLAYLKRGHQDRGWALQADLGGSRIDAAAVLGWPPFGDGNG